jgi:hypothetical protein
VNPHGQTASFRRGWVSCMVEPDLWLSARFVEGNSWFIEGLHASRGVVQESSKFRVQGRVDIVDFLGFLFVEGLLYAGSTQNSTKTVYHLNTVNSSACRVEQTLSCSLRRRSSSWQAGRIKANSVVQNLVEQFPGESEGDLESPMENSFPQTNSMRLLRTRHYRIGPPLALATP